MNRGQVVGGRYEIEAELASGGMGTVYTARSLRDGSRCAIKVIKPDFSFAPGLAERFRREAQLMDAIDHPGVVRSVDCGEMPDGGTFIAMELLSGGTLAEHLTRRGAMSVPEVVTVVRGICDGLSAVHAEGVIHRDLKPSNVFVTDDGTVKLIDFGVAKATELERLTITGQTVGTARYMAPEQLTGSSAVDFRADLYSVGVIAYSMLAGEPPYPGGPTAIPKILANDAPPLRSLAPNVSENLERFVARCMALDPLMRPASASELAGELEAVAAGAAPRGARDSKKLTVAEGPRAKPPRASAGGGEAPRTGSRVAGAPSEKNAGRIGWVVGGGAVVAVLAIVLVVMIVSDTGAGEDAPSGSAQSSSPIVEMTELTEHEEPEDDGVSPARRPIALSTDPAGAMITTEDGVLIGSTPTLVPRPAAGETLVVDIRLPGYEPARARFTDVSPPELDVTLSPVRAPARPIDVHTPSGYPPEVLDPWGPPSRMDLHRPGRGERPRSRYPETDVDDPWP